MIDITFNVEGNTYKLTNDERNYILRKSRKIEDIYSEKFGEEVLSGARFFRTVQNVFAYIARTYPLSCEEVISSLVGLKEVTESVRGASEAVMRSIGTEAEER